MKEKYKKGELSGLILDYFFVQLELPITMIFYPPSEIYKLFNTNSSYNRQRINHALHVLGMKKLIKIEGTGVNTRIRIFPSNLKKVDRYQFSKMVLPKFSKWDGKWRIIIFDISESKKGIRDKMAKKMKELGFRAIQKSTFVYPFECENEVKMIKNYFSLGNELSYIVAERIDNDRSIRKIFSL